MRRRALGSQAHRCPPPPLQMLALATHATVLLPQPLVHHPPPLPPPPPPPRRPAPATPTPLACPHCNEMQADSKTAAHHGVAHQHALLATLLQRIDDVPAGRRTYRRARRPTLLHEACMRKAKQSNRWHFGTYRQLPRRIEALQQATPSRAISQRQPRPPTHAAPPPGSLARAAAGTGTAGPSPLATLAASSHQPTLPYRSLFPSDCGLGPPGGLALAVAGAHRAHRHHRLLRGQLGAGGGHQPKVGAGWRCDGGGSNGGGWVGGASR